MAFESDYPFLPWPLGVVGSFEPVQNPETLSLGLFSFQCSKPLLSQELSFMSIRRPDPSFPPSPVTRKLPVFLLFAHPFQVSDGSPYRVTAESLFHVFGQRMYLQRF